MIVIISVELTSNEEDGSSWVCWLKISQDAQTWMLPATAPGGLLESELQAYFDKQEAELWRVADTKRYAPDVYRYTKPERVLKALSGVLLNEINFLRSRSGVRDPITKEDLERAIEKKLRGF